MQVQLKTRNGVVTKLRVGDKVLFAGNGDLTILRKGRSLVNHLYFHESWAKSKTFCPPRGFRGSQEIIMQLISFSSGLSYGAIREPGSAFAYELFRSAEVK